MGMHRLREFGLIYISSPYSRFEGGIDKAWALTSEATAKVAAALEGVSTISPIVHGHALSLHADLDPFDHEWWMRRDTGLMKKADAMAVIKLKGWRESRGVAEEFCVFKNAGKPIYFVDPETLEVTEDDW